MCIISRKALNAKDSQIEKLANEKLKLEENYKKLLDKYDVLIGNYEACKKIILEQEKTITSLTPARDSKGRYCKRS